jgi:toxin ParE1/3/4
MIRAKFSPKAGRDLDEIFRFISSDNPDAAQCVRETILDVADFLAQNPEIGRRIRNAAERHAQIRWFVVPKFRNYLIFYQPFRETVMVVRVLHAAQDWTRFFPPANL